MGGRNGPLFFLFTGPQLPHKVKERLRRLFCNPYPILEKKIHNSLGQINEYLTAENDPKRRSEFLDQYGLPSPAHAFHIKARKINRLKAPAIDSRPPFRQWMVADAFKTEVSFLRK